MPPNAGFVSGGAASSSSFARTGSDEALHSRYAGRVPAGIDQPIVVSKDGQRHARVMPGSTDREVRTILSVGLACSECFSGRTLAKILRPGLDYERRAMEDLALGKPAPPLSIHTSGGVSKELSTFLEALEPHLPWKDAADLDWCVSLQLEGASAVWAAIDMVLQETALRTGDYNRNLVAVGEKSYHGPPSVSPGGREPLFRKSYQVKYPVPVAGEPVDETALLERFDEFLREHGRNVGVMLIEPQWGSSQAAMPWPKSLLKRYASMARSYGIGIVADEIMCGLGRHGQQRKEIVDDDVGTTTSFSSKPCLFVSEAWDLDPDAVTFGKAMGGGVFPISGAILKRGRDRLRESGATAMQSHTYAGSSVRALMTAAGVLNEVDRWLPAVSKLGEDMEAIFRGIEDASDGLVVAHGQGLMWGGLFAREEEEDLGGAKERRYDRSAAVRIFRAQCEEVGILPYFVPAGGFMVTPLLDVDADTVREIGRKLEAAVVGTKLEIGWIGGGGGECNQEAREFEFKCNGMNVEIERERERDQVEQLILSPPLRGF